MVWLTAVTIRMKMERFEVFRRVTHGSLVLSGKGEGRIRRRPGFWFGPLETTEQKEESPVATGRDDEIGCNEQV